MRIRYGLFGIVLVAACVGGNNSRAPVPKVLMIGVDGVRSDILALASTPTVDSLARTGTFTLRARTTYPSVSGPGWSSYLTGVWPDKHGVTNNEFENKNYESYPDILSRIESVRPELHTFAVADWLPLVTNDHNGPVISDRIDSKHVLDGYALGWLEGDEESVRLAEQALAVENPDAMFVYLGNPDETSHHFQSIGPEYRQAIETADRHIGRLIRAITNRPTFAREDWLILISTDHGRTTDGDHGGDTDDERNIFYLASGPSTDVGSPSDTTYVVDVAVTALTHLKIPIDPGWQLDGKAVGLKKP